MAGFISQSIDRVKSHPRRFISYVAALTAVALLVFATLTLSLPDNEIRVTSFEPDGRVGMQTNITVKFSKKMVATDSVDRPVLNPPLKITPPIPGIARWIETDVLRFFPDGSLLPATRYSVAVQSDRTWEAGLKIVKPKTYQFFTPGLRFESASGWTEPVPDVNESVRLVARLVFNYPVNLKDLRDKLTIRTGGNAAKTQLNFVVRPTDQGYPPSDISTSAMAENLTASDVQVFSESIAKTKSDQTYVLKIDKGLLCQECGDATADPMTLSITIDRLYPLVINSTQSYSQGELVFIAVDFSQQISPETAGSYVSIEPKVDFTTEVSWSRLILRGPFRPGETYTVSIAKGMPSQLNHLLEEDFSTRVLIADLNPSVKFTSHGLFLPRSGNGLLELSTINLSKVVVETEQVFANNLVYFLLTGRGSVYGGDANYYDTRAEQLGRSIFIKDKELDGVRNTPLATTVDIKSIIADTAKGIFRVSVRDKEQRWIAASRYVLITDLGLSVRMADNYLMVWVNSLSTVTPTSGVTVTLYSKNNQPLLQGKTDSRGIVVFKEIGPHLAGFEPFVITAEKQGDLSYLRLDESLIPTSDFDVAGRPLLTSGYEAFVYADRGVYRPGDTAHFVSVVRGPEAKLPPGFPYLLTVFDPEGRKFQSFKMTTGAGMTGVDFVIPDYVPTGRYAVAATIGEDLQIGRMELLVEDFMPDKIRVDLRTLSSSYATGDTLKATVSARLLFGPPGAGYQVKSDMVIESQPFEPKGFSEYTFSADDRTFNRMSVNLRDTLLDDSGLHTFTYQLPPKLVAPSALKGLISATVSESGGRGVSAYAEVLIHPYPTYLGIKLARDGYTKPGEPVVAMVVAVNCDGQAVDLSGCKVRFNRIVYNTLLKRGQTGDYQWVSERKTQPLDSTVVSITGLGTTATFTPVAYGSYQITAEDPKGGHLSAVDLWVSGWGYAPWAMDHPDKIELALDKKEYQPGEKAILQVRAPFGGKLLVTLERGEVIDVITRDMSENTAELQLPVKKEYLPNIYVTAAVVRPADSLEPNKPARAFGMVPLAVSTSAKRIGMTLTAPDVIAPHSTITVAVQLDRPRASDVTVAAVDAGILQLTEFKTPDPLTFFFGKKQPHFKPYDLYSFLYPHVNQATSHLAAGDKSLFAAARQRHLNPFTANRVKSVALWSGVLHTDSEGKTSATFDIPEFNGKLVVMAVSSQGELFGSATRDIIVRDNIVLQESFPRFISPRDSFDGLITLFNNTGQTADITVTATPTGPLKLAGPASLTIPVEKGREGHAIFRFKADDAPGTISVAVSATAGSDKSSLHLEMANRPAMPLVTQYGSGTVIPGKPATFALPSDWLATTDQYVLQTSGLPATALAKQVQYLLQYPYGCVEQTTSRVFPLLYYNDLVKVVEPALFGGHGHEYFVQQGIIRLSSMILPDRSFAFWPGGTYSNSWSTLYASHFLTEASRSGFTVDKKLLGNIYDNLNNIARGRRTDRMTDVHRVYAAYILAQAGKLDQSIVSYLKRLDATKFLPDTRYQLAGALGISGNMAEAVRLIPTDIQPNLFDPETGGDFGSGVRSDAIGLDVLLAISPGNPSIDVLAGSLLQRAQAGRWYSTQENAFALMALGKYFKTKSSLGFTGTLAIFGDKTFTIDSTGFRLTRADLGGKNITVSVLKGEGTCYYYWQASGIPRTTAAPEFDRGIRVRRQYLDEDALPIDPAKVKLGDRIVCLVTAEAVDKPLYNVVINDLLPAGLEVENPRLKTTPRLSWIPSGGISIDYQDIRDDRILLFANIYPGQPVKFYYSLRAISAGEFKVPPVAAECMYNPLIAGSASSGSMTITR